MFTHTNYVVFVVYSFIILCDGGGAAGDRDDDVFVCYDYFTYKKMCTKFISHHFMVFIIKIYTES